MDWARLAQAVIRQRQRRAWSQGDLARRSGVGVRTIGRLESGREPVGEQSLAAVEAALGWRDGSVLAVLKGGRPRPEVDDDLAAIHEAWPLLNARDRRTVRALAQQLAGR